MAGSLITVGQFRRFSVGQFSFLGSVRAASLHSASCSLVSAIACLLFVVLMVSVVCPHACFWFSFFFVVSFTYVYPIFFLFLVVSFIGGYCCIAAFHNHRCVFLIFLPLLCYDALMFCMFLFLLLPKIFLPFLLIFSSFHLFVSRFC